MGKSKRPRSLPGEATATKEIPGQLVLPGMEYDSACPNCQWPYDRTRYRWQCPCCHWKDSCCV